MPRRRRWLVPAIALIACAGTRAGASAAPQAMPDGPSPVVELRVARAAQAATIHALVTHEARRERERADADAVVKAAAAQLGDAYAWGGTGPDAFDCSGLTAYVFARVGVALPHTSEGQAGRGRAVARADIRRGDLVFFSTAGAGASHVGIATGRTTVISATNAGVLEHATDDAYWGGHYAGARRVL